MSNDIWHELFDGLGSLYKEHRKKAPPSIIDIFRTIGQVLRNHQVTSAELMTALAIRDFFSNDANSISATDIQTVYDLKARE